MKRIPSVLFLVPLLFLFSACTQSAPETEEKSGFEQNLSAGDTTWNAGNSLPSPISGSITDTAPLVLGDIATNAVSVTLPSKSLPASTQITLQNPNTKLTYNASEMDVLGNPIELGTGSPTRLDEPATVSFTFDPAKLDPKTEKSMIRIAYFDGQKWDLIRPKEVNMETGLISFETYHFSLFGATKIKDETKLTEEWIKSKTLDEELKKSINSKSDYIANQIVDLTLQKMGFADESIKRQVLADVLKDDGYKEIYDAYQSGETVDMSQKIAILAGQKIVQIVPESAYAKALENITGGAEDIAAVSKAAGYATEGQYKEAAKIIGEKIADKFLITTATKIAAEVVNGQIQSWKNTEVEAAYKAYKNGADGYFWGYNVDKGDFDTVWDQMRGIRRQLEIEAIKKENAVRSESGMSPLTEAQENMVRAGVKDSYKRQFAVRETKEAEMEKSMQQMKLLMDAYKQANFLDSTLGPVGLDKGFGHEEKLEVLYHFAQKMMKDTKRFELSDKTGLTMPDKLSVEDVVQAARAYFSGPDGKKKYEQYLTDRFGIKFFPALSDLAGKMSGSFTVTDVFVDPALKEKKGSGGKEECNFDINWEEIKGKTIPLSLDITPSGETSGSMAVTMEDSDAQVIPFSYEEGTLKASLSKDGGTMSISLNMSDDEKNYVGSGSLIINYGSQLKITATANASKPMPAPPAPPVAPNAPPKQ